MQTLHHQKTKRISTSTNLVPYDLSSKSEPAVLRARPFSCSDVVNYNTTAQCYTRTASLDLPRICIDFSDSKETDSENGGFHMPPDYDSEDYFQSLKRRERKKTRSQEYLHLISMSESSILHEQQQQRLQSNINFDVESPPYFQPIKTQFGNLAFPNNKNNVTLETIAFRYIPIDNSLFVEDSEDESNTSVADAEPRAVYDDSELYETSDDDSDKENDDITYDDITNRCYGDDSDVSTQSFYRRETSVDAITRSSNVFSNPFNSIIRAEGMPKLKEIVEESECEQQQEICQHQTQQQESFHDVPVMLKEKLYQHQSWEVIPNTLENPVICETLGNDAQPTEVTNFSSPTTCEHGWNKSKVVSTNRIVLFLKKKTNNNADSSSSPSISSMEHSVIKSKFRVSFNSKKQAGQNLLNGGLKNEDNLWNGGLENGENVLNENFVEQDIIENALTVPNENKEQISSKTKQLETSNKDEDIEHLEHNGIIEDEKEQSKGNLKIENFEEEKRRSTSKEDEFQKFENNEGAFAAQNDPFFSDWLDCGEKQPIKSNKNFSSTHHSTSRTNKYDFTMIDFQSIFCGMNVISAIDKGPIVSTACYNTKQEVATTRSDTLQIKTKPLSTNIKKVENDNLQNGNRLSTTKGEEMNNGQALSYLSISTQQGKLESRKSYGIFKSFSEYKKEGCGNCKRTCSSIFVELENGRSLKPPVDIMRSKQQTCDAHQTDSKTFKLNVTYRS